jgi:gamma-glutamyltranspeptidase/glutathione hydrolase
MYRDVEVLTFPFPASGGALIESLNILETFDPRLLAEDTPRRHHIVLEAFHMAIVDHQRHWSDRSGLGDLRRQRLLEKDFAARRAALIRPGQPVVTTGFSAAPAHGLGTDNTTHVSVIDQWGNAVALTQTIGRFFGNKMTTPSLGFPYNSLLEGGHLLADRSAIPNTMCPTIVATGGEALLVLGSASGDRIPGIVATIISNVVDRRLALGAAIDAPRVLWSISKDPGPHVEIWGPISTKQIDEIAGYGYPSIVRVEPPVNQSRFSRFGAVNAIHLETSTRIQTGVGDARRNGSAIAPRF